MEICALVHEFQLAPPRGDLDYTESKLLQSAVTKAPLIVFYGRNRQGVRVTLNVHGVPQGFPTQWNAMQTLAMKIQAKLPANTHPALHDLSPVHKLPFYGYHTSHSHFLKLSFYDKDIAKDLMRIVSSGEVGLKMQPYEAHIDVFQHFYAEFNLRGMDWIQVAQCSYRKPVKAGLTPRDIVVNNIPKASPSLIEVDCHYSAVVRYPMETLAEFPNIEIPSITQLWLEQIQAYRQRGEAFPLTLKPFPMAAHYPHNLMQDPTVALQFQYLAAVQKNEEKETLSVEACASAVGHAIVNEDDEKLIDDLLDISKPKALAVKQPVTTPSVAEFMNVQTPESKRERELMSTGERFTSQEVRAFYHSAARPELKPHPDSAYPQLHASVSSREFASGITNKSLLDAADSVPQSCDTTPAHPYSVSPCMELSQRVVAKTQSQQREPSFLVYFYLEVVPETRIGLLPDPLIDPVYAIVYQTVDDYSKSVDGVIAISRFACTHSVLWGQFQHNVEWAESESEVFAAFCLAWERADPDVILSFDTERESLSYLLARAAVIGFPLTERLTRSRDVAGGIVQGKQNKYAKRLHGRIVIDAWRMIKAELKLQMYSFPNMVMHVFGYRVPIYSWDTVRTWLKALSTLPCALDVFREKVALTRAMIEHFGLFDRAIHLARIYGIDLLSVFMRGSQFRVEAIVKRYCLYNTDYVLLSATQAQVTTQRDLESIPLVMEPKKAFSNDPVLVLDFQSLYPSIMIAYNLCYSTCLGKLRDEKYKQFGVTNMKGEVFAGFREEDIHVTPNNIGFVRAHVRVGVIPRLMHVLLQTRIMTKLALKKTTVGSSAHAKLMSQQLGIKLLCNTVYGYSGAGHTGRMPCSDIADSIVGLARKTLETAQRIVSSQEDWGAEVIYGDTDSLMIKLPGRTVAQAFALGREIVAAINSHNPAPVEILLEKVYCPFLIIAKKHYSGFKYDSPTATPVLESRGIETVRRDNCLAASLMQEKALHILFETKDLYRVYKYLIRQWNKIQMGQVRLAEFILYKKVLMGSYKVMPHAAIVCERKIERDRMAAPHYGERVGYVVASAPPNTPIKDCVFSPEEFLQKGLALNYEYYMHNLILPVLNRVLEPVDVKIAKWYENFPRKYLQALPPVGETDAHKGRLDQIFRSARCMICSQLGDSNPCEVCRGNTRFLSFHIYARLAEIERHCLELTDVCRTCTQRAVGDIECISLECPVFYQRASLLRTLNAYGPRLSREVQAEPMINTVLV